MPTETIIVVAGVALAFIAFMAALAWAEMRTRHLTPPGGSTE